MKGLTTCRTSPIKIVYHDNDKKLLNFQMHNDLQASHVIAIFAVFKKLLQIWSYKMKHFVFKTFKKLILEFQFWKILGGKCPLAPLSYTTVVYKLSTNMHCFLFFLKKWSNLLTEVHLEAVNILLLKVVMHQVPPCVSPRSSHWKLTLKFELVTLKWFVDNLFITLHCNSY